LPRDLQLTKEAVMRGVLLAQDLLSAMNSLLPHLAFNPGRMREAATAELFATAAALRQVRAGVPFRAAYQQAARSKEEWRRSQEEGLAAYETEGTPGQVNPDLVRRRLKQASGWIP
jgi:argininosuccinate lyase